MSVSAPSPRVPSLWHIALIFTAELLLILAFQLPGVMDFQKFAFYDEGAWIHLDQLFASGRIPTIDLAYSYGNLPLLLTRAWFHVFGRSPWTFLSFLTTCNLLGGVGIGVALHAAGANWRRIGAACVLLPMAIFPNNYSLMHPLEMCLLIWSLAMLARNRFGTALAFATLALFTKPSMAYVLGLLLLIAGFRHIFRPRPDALPAQRSRQRRLETLQLLIPPSITAIAVMLVSIPVMGMKPAFANIIPIAANDAYKRMDFGIFHAGRAFWLFKGDGTFWDVFRHYFYEPTVFWILASLLLWTLGVRAAHRIWRARSVGTTVPRASDPFILTLALLHAAFVFAFYAWAGSWTYYSYLLVLGLLIGLQGRRQTIILRIMLFVCLIGYHDRFTIAFSKWKDHNNHPADTGGLWVYTDVLEEARLAREVAQRHNALYLVNGALPNIWPEAQTPPVWFLSPGIPTPSEMAQIKDQMRHADVIVIYREYDPKQEAWAWPELAEDRKPFELRTLWGIEEMPVFRSKYFLILKRHYASLPSPSTRQPSTDPP